MYTFSELIWNIRKVGKIDSRKMQGQSAFTVIIQKSSGVKKLVHCAATVNPASTTARSKVVFLAQVLENRHHTLPFLSAGTRTATDMDGTLHTDL